jgi:hypothetical protein
MMYPYPAGRWLIPAVFAAACSSLAAGQSVTYLSPDKHQVRVGEQVRLRVEVGEALQPQRAAWPADAIDWLFVRLAGTQENMHEDRVRPARAQDDFLSVTLSHAGVALIGFDTRPAVQQVAGKDLRAFLDRYVESAALPDARPPIQPTAKLNVRQVESTKTLVRVSAEGDQRSHSATAQSKSGQAVEIRPLADPTMVAVGSDLPVRAYVNGSKKVGVRMLATSVAAGKTQQSVTDASGATHFRITHAGLWRVEFHWAEPLKSDPTADWAIYSATLTFEVEEQGAGE